MFTSVFAGYDDQFESCILDSYATNPDPSTVRIYGFELLVNPVKCTSAVILAEPVTSKLYDGVQPIPSSLSDMSPLRNG